MGSSLWTIQNRDPDILCFKTLRARMQHPQLEGRGWSQEPSAQLRPAPILGVLEVQSYLVSQNLDTDFETVRAPVN